MKPIIVKLLDKHKRDLILAATKRFRRESNTSGIAIEKISKNLFINEHLTIKLNLLLKNTKKVAKSACITKTADIINLINSIPGLFWKCSDCTNSYILLDSAGIQKIVKTKLNVALDSMKKDVDAAIIKINESETSNCRMKYSDVVKDKSQPVILIHHNNSNQSSSSTKAEILRNVDPVQENLQLTKVKHVKDGGILISCGSRADNEKLKVRLKEKMSAEYKVKEVGGVLQEIRLVGMTQKFSADDLKTYLIKCNSNVFSHQSNCNILKIFPTKKNDNIFQAIIQVDNSVYDHALAAGNLFVGYDSCSVYDALDVHRCFKCNEFNHYFQRCSKAISCPICGQDHDLENCESNSKNCSIQLN
ncbi:unnamed protein product [Phaedon cochleariae]|uniref:CCHC-type domain-containing protein n=1 Tax=Phaedon cochleariae TaxID=80249 RepID=A0A9N9X2U4_PHACE|nr:unnamed protein product [Phaedon cochleariae]